MQINTFIDVFDNLFHWQDSNQITKTKSKIKKFNS
jgi:hypothetical protein